MTVRFGVSPIAWANDDMPELGGDTPLERILSDAHAIGFDGVELGGKFPRDPVALKAALAPHALTLIGGWYSANLLTRSADDEIAALRDHLALLKAMDCGVFVIAETSNAIHGDRSQPLTATPRLGNDAWTTFGARLSAVADYITGEGLRFAYHHHLGTVVESPGDLDAFLKATSASVGLTFDTGHAALGGVDPVDTIKRHADRIAHVHCKDIRGPVHRAHVEAGKSFLDGVVAGMFTVPGDGDIDFGRVMNALADINYAGWVVVEAEQDPAVADPRTYGEIGLKTLKAAASNANLI